MAFFDRSIPPGGEGKITLRVKTKGYQEDHAWSAKANTNDPEKNVVYLKVTAFVKVPIYVSPRYVYLTGFEGRSVTRTINIKAGLKKPLTLDPGQFNLEGKLTYKLEEIEKGRRFRVLFTSNPGPPRIYQGYLNLKTNYPEKPMINIRIRGRFVRIKKQSK